jgi:hypothetical protein
MPRLDPGIHPPGPEADVTVGCRVEPGNDKESCECVYAPTVARTRGENKEPAQDRLPNVEAIA